MKSESCGICGASGKRECPAINGRICTACCGSKRVSAIACTPECEYNPFGINSYDLWLRGDGTCQPKMHKFVVDHLASKSIYEEVGKYAIGDRPQDDEDFASAAAFLVHNKLFLEPYEDDRCLADVWERESWQGLTNDERMMIQCRRHAYPALLEIQQTLDDKAMSCLDLLDKSRKPFVVYDRNTAGRAARFTRLLTWICHYPNFSRLGPMGMELDHPLSSIVMDEIRSGSLREGISEVEYLKIHFVAVCRQATATAKRRLEEMIRSLDANPWIAAYALRADREEIAGLLAKKPEFEREPPSRSGEADALCYAWLRKGESEEIENAASPQIRSEFQRGGVGVLGQVQLHADRLTLTSFGEQKFRSAREKLEKYCGNRISFTIESERPLKDELLKRFVEEARDEDEPVDQPDPANQIPAEVQRTLLRDFHNKHYRQFLDDSIPALKGMTPREAAKDEHMRPELLSLMKEHLNGIDRRNRKEGLDLNIDWVLGELNLDELKAG